MNNNTTREIVAQIAATIDIPESAYEKAEKRYKDLADWFGRPECQCAKYNPHVYPQGSFRLGTVVRPLNEDDRYDLDFGCRLRSGISKATHTQKELKQLVGLDMEAYRKARQIEEKLEEKHRCWRLNYADEVGFHMDGVPSIPEVEAQRILLQEAMVKSGSAEVLAQNVIKHAGSITDKRKNNYETISADWRISNSEGYALWFESRMRLAMPLLEKRAFEAKAAKVDDLPARKWKSPLQLCVQILKRHRDVMFADDPDGKPISIIITTLAGKAYQGEQEIDDALKRILTDMDAYINKGSPRVPNPVNPVEDFADKWGDSKYQQHNLETKFRQWLAQARQDFKVIESTQDANSLVEQIQAKFASALDADDLEKRLGFTAAPAIAPSKKYSITEAPAKPWKDK